MKDYNQYVTAVNKIFDYLAKMKTGWNSIDNINYIESIEEYKQIVIRNAEAFKTPVYPQMDNSMETLEALGND